MLMQLEDDSIEDQVLGTIATKLVEINSITDKNEEWFGVVHEKYQSLHLKPSHTQSLEPCSPAPLLEPKNFTYLPLYLPQQTQFFPLFLPENQVQDHQVQVISTSKMSAQATSSQAMKHKKSVNTANAVKKNSDNRIFFQQMYMLKHEIRDISDLRYSDIQYLFPERKRISAPSVSSDKPATSSAKDHVTPSKKGKKGRRKERVIKTTTKKDRARIELDDGTNKLSFILANMKSNKTENLTQLEDLSRLFSHDIAQTFTQLTDLENHSTTLTHVFPPIAYIGIIQCQYAAKTETFLAGEKRMIQIEDRYSRLARNCLCLAQDMITHCANHQFQDSNDNIKATAIIAAMSLKFTQYLPTTESKSAEDLTITVAINIMRIANINDTNLNPISAWRVHCQILLLLSTRKDEHPSEALSLTLLQATITMLTRSMAFQQYDLCAALVTHCCLHWDQLRTTNNESLNLQLSDQIIDFLSLISSAYANKNSSHSEVNHIASIQLALITDFENTIPPLFSLPVTQVAVQKLKQEAQQKLKTSLSEIISLDVWIEKEAKEQLDKITSISKLHHEKMKTKSTISSTTAPTPSSVTRFSDEQPNDEVTLTSDAASDNKKPNTTRTAITLAEVQQQTLSTTASSTLLPVQEQWEQALSQAIKHYRLKQTDSADALKDRALQSADTPIKKMSVLTACSTEKLLQHKINLKRIGQLAKNCCDVKCELQSHLTNAQRCFPEALISSVDGYGYSWLADKNIPSEDTMMQLAERFQKHGDISQLSEALSNAIESYHQALNFYEVASQEEKIDYSDYVFSTMRIALSELYEQQQQISSAKPNLVAAWQIRKSIFSHIGIYKNNEKKPSKIRHQKSAYTSSKESLDESIKDLSLLYGDNTSDSFTQR